MIDDISLPGEVLEAINLVMQPTLLTGHVFKEQPEGSELPLNLPWSRVDPPNSK